MKKIEAVVRPERAGHILAMLGTFDHPGLMVTEIEGHGKQRGVEHQARGKTYRVGLLTKTKIEMIVEDEDTDMIVKMIRLAAVTGKVGDGKIFVYPVKNALRIRTGEEGTTAL
jgi:nitrogen regulatory protein P-II 1